MLRFCIVLLVAVHLSVAAPADSGVPTVPGDEVHFDFVFPNLTALEERPSARSNDFRGDKIYAVSAFSKVNWFTAQHICSFQGMSLASITSAVEQERLYRYLTTNGFNSNNEQFWLGGSDLSSRGSWLWSSTGRPLQYRNWAPGEPNNSGGSERCLSLTTSGSWNDIDCEAQLYFICENRCPLDSYSVPIYNSA